MSLSLRIVFKFVGVLAGLAALAIVSLWGLVGLQRNLRLAQEEYRELRALQNAILHAATARLDSELVESDDEAMLAELEARDDNIDAVIEAMGAGQEVGNAQGSPQSSAIRNSVAQLREAMDELHNSNGDYLAAVRSFEHVLKHLDDLAEMQDDVVAEAQAQADARMRSTIAAIAGVSAFILVAITWFNVSQYRSVIASLRRLHEGVSRIADGQFHERLPLEGSTEFQLLSHEFNRMAAELEEVYTELERKVETKSRALVRSERLASVGYLAAGIAHEINNPLNIISGYAELSLKQWNREGRPPGTEEEVATALATIRDEAFRCKSIIEKLLSMSRWGESPRERVSLRQVASEVATMVAGLLQFRNRHVEWKFQPDDDLPVLANANELKQVLLNVTLNALQAVAPDHGRVELTGSTLNGRVILDVRDNGRGMTPETLDKVFEPFFTDRRGTGSTGVGLGLSICHAIIESHGGRIRAQSPGIGGGSCFTIELPRWAEEKK